MSIIQHKRSSTSGNVPSSLLQGEIAINEADSKLFALDNGVVTAKRLIEPRQLIVKGSVAAVANLTLDLTPANIGTWQGFEIFLSEIKAATDGANLLLRLGDVTSIYSGSTDYKTAAQGCDTVAVSGGLDSTNASSASSIQLTLGGGIGNAAGEGGLAFIHLSTNDPAYGSVLPKAFGDVVNHNSSGNVYGRFFAGEKVAAITMTRCQFLFSSGNIANCNYTLLGVG
jgi:hypothetical protein